MAKKLESNLKNMVLSLLLISSIMAGALGYVYSLTKGPIDEAVKKAELDAIKAVVPDFNSDPAKSKKTIEDLDYYPVTKDNTPVGCAVKTFTDKGFSGRFTLMVGFLPDGTINQIKVLEQKETPGLGTKMSEPKFKDQFVNKNPEKMKMLVKKDGGEIDAITASTITSRAFCDAIQKAFDGYKKHFMNTASADSTQTEKGGKQ